VWENQSIQALGGKKQFAAFSSIILFVSSECAFETLLVHLHTP
jgi:hypothetical protein